MPYIKNFSWKGELVVGWSTNLVPYQDDLAVIPDDKVAIEATYFQTEKKEISKWDESLGARNLQPIEEFEWESEEFQRQLKLLIANALSVEVLKEDPDESD